MAISQSALRSQLIRKYGKDPRAVLRRLGLDEDLLKPKEPGARGGLSGEHAVEIFDFLKDKLDPDDVSELNILMDRLLGETEVAERSAEDDEPDAERMERMRGFLRDKGMGAGDVEKALAFMPKPGTAGGMGGRSTDRMAGDYARMFPGAADIEIGFSTARDDPRLAFDRQRRAPTQAEIDDYARMFPETERFDF